MVVMDEVDEARFTGLPGLAARRTGLLTESSPSGAERLPEQALALEGAARRHDEPAVDQVALEQEKARVIDALQAFLASPPG
jgi:hypothetical protein